MTSPRETRSSGKLYSAASGETLRLPGGHAIALSVLAESMYVVSLPLVTEFRGVNHRECALFLGPKGWGEWAPFPEYRPAEAARWLQSALEAAWGTWPSPRRTDIPINATVPAVAATAVSGILSGYPGCSTVKVKVAAKGQNLAADLARVQAVRDHLTERFPGRDTRIRVDANMGWSPAEAIEAITALARYGLEYVEQPCARTADLARVRRALVQRGIAVKIAADEAIRKAADPLEFARMGAADLAVLKVPPSGGVAAALGFVEQLYDVQEMPVVVSSALDSSVGISAGLALAAALPALEHACGLGTVRLLQHDVVRQPLCPENGFLPVTRVIPDPALLEKYAAPPARQHWWQKRLRLAGQALNTA